MKRSKGSRPAKQRPGNALARQARRRAAKSSGAGNDRVADHANAGSARSLERPWRASHVRVRPAPGLAVDSRRWWQGCTVAVSALSLVGCSFMPPSLTGRTVANVQPEPLLRIQGHVLTAEQAYAMGKAALSAGDVQRALLSFEKALSLKPQWADAENGRVVALSRLGRTDEAIMLGQRAVALGATSAELHGNLGLLLDERGESRKAAIHLARAAQLDPQNPAWQRWSMAAAVKAPSATTATAPTPTRPAAVPATDQPTAVRDLSGAPSRVTQASLAVPASPAQSGAATGADNAGSRWIQQAPHVLALTPAAPTGGTGAARIGQPLAAAEPGTYAPVIVLSSRTVRPAAAHVTASTTTAPSTAPARTALTPAQPGSAQGSPMGAVPLQASLTVLSRIEISNGHGRNGLAREMAKGLQTVMSGPARVTNHTNFRVLQTEVQYRSAEERSAAQVLARSLGVPEERVVLNNRLRESAPVRLLLGRDAPDTQEAITDTLARARLNLRG